MKVHYSTDQYGYLLTPCRFYLDNKVGGYSCVNCPHFEYKSKSEQYVECKVKNSNYEVFDN